MFWVLLFIAAFIGIIQFLVKPSHKAGNGNIYETDPNRIAETERARTNTNGWFNG
ncbi:hypothetical protein [Peribacillus deserti]|uniref:hypothetical protein n=1 Tax=Peribacillus deserti TaxID=673318 RepID=UPI0015E12477|nr:hypothetical protein [Peribacillus deserti]